jgi:hypothetical protein
MSGNPANPSQEYFLPPYSRHCSRKNRPPHTEPDRREHFLPTTKKKISRRKKNKKKKMKKEDAGIVPLCSPSPLW